MAVIQTTEREFLYNGITLPDPGADLDEKGVIEFYADQYPELTNAGFDPPNITINKDGTPKATYTIGARTGTKG